MADPYVMAQAVLLGVVERVTEFLPVSSTGHLIVAGYFIDFPEPMGKIFEVVIQLGAILAMIPGVSRSDATILGAMLLGVDRHFA